MTATLEREIGGLRADVQGLKESVDRLIYKFESHDASDNLRFAAIEVARAREAGIQASAMRWRTMAHQFVSIAGGGALGAVIARLTGGH
jgi:hypothetical protein